MASREAYSHVIYSGRGLWLLKGCCKQWIWGFSEMRERIKLHPTRNAQINMLSSKKEIGLITNNHENVLLYLWAAMCDCNAYQKMNIIKCGKKLKLPWIAIPLPHYGNTACTSNWRQKKNQWEKGTWLNSGIYIPNTILSVLVLNKLCKHTIPLSNNEMISMYIFFDNIKI